MVTKQGNSLKKNIIGIAVGFLIYILIEMIVLFATTGWILDEKLSGTVIKVLGVCIPGIAAYVGCLVSGAMTGDNKLIGCGCVIGISILLRGFLSAFIYDTSIVGVFVNTLPELVGCFLALITLQYKKRSRGGRKIRKRYL